MSPSIVITGLLAAFTAFCYLMAAITPPEYAVRHGAGPHDYWYLFGTFSFFATAIAAFFAWPDFKKFQYDKRDQIEHQAFLEENKPRDPNSPPTPEEIKKAVNQLRISNAFYEQAFKAKDGDEQLGLLTRATRELLKARPLDPAATLTTTVDNMPLTETQDDLAAKYLYLESLLRYQQGLAQNEAEKKWSDARFLQPTK